MRTINLESWRGKRDEVAIDPAQVEFRAVSRPGTSCRGCMFERQWSEVCTGVMAHAIQRGMRSCNDGVIYFAVERDPRQIALPVENILVDS